MEKQKCYRSTCTWHQNSLIINFKKCAKLTNKRFFLLQKKTVKSVNICSLSGLRMTESLHVQGWCWCWLLRWAGLGERLATAGVLACNFVQTVSPLHQVFTNHSTSGYSHQSIKPWANHIVQELCESRGGRPGLSVLTSLLVSVDVKLYWTMLRHWSQLVPNLSTDIRGH